MRDDESDSISEIMLAVPVDSSLGLGRLTQHDGKYTSLLRGLQRLGPGGLLLNGLLIESFNGKSQTLPLDFAYACGSPLNENDQ